MCRERTSPSLRQNVSFHLCLQESYVLTVAHSNKNVFCFNLLKARAGANAKAGSVGAIVIKWAGHTANTWTTTAITDTNAVAAPSGYESTSVITYLVIK